MPRHKNEIATTVKNMAVVNSLKKKRKIDAVNNRKDKGNPTIPAVANI